ncbi:MAG: hypothetical protein UR68_C0040G0010 [Candidatus Roizmanbacteria bacterium GW2011_GWA2_35_19]|uniref:Uncharacterized protein n=1 Tax=Candidatus Roizmanbacteria bacterium GW2011_GWA2_35_19 TaxID=1618478 RepID=A0A0G0BMI1_9BACT|nr:MAG: hypothetical protein UR68_C0040G0010 [Candidatus Roizmanbacteria bacterium GW2011_GWA2_35_19]
MLSSPCDLLAQASLARLVALGYNVTKYIKFIITKEAFETVEAYPEYKMGPGLEEKTKAALKEFKNGKTRKLESIDELDSL